MLRILHVVGAVIVTGVKIVANNKIESNEVLLLEFMNKKMSKGLGL